jgi:hypothetical protein
MRSGLRLLGSALPSILELSFMGIVAHNTVNLTEEWCLRAKRLHKADFNHPIRMYEEEIDQLLRKISLARLKIQWCKNQKEKQLGEKGK